MRIAVTGNSGQVVTSLMEIGAQDGLDMIAVGRPHLDLRVPDTVKRALTRVEPDVIVSAAAYTAVDRAEADAATATAVNVTGARAVAQAARDIGVPLIHLSTDYVFGGSLGRPHLECDETRPGGVYAATKLAGERAVMAVHGANTAVVRTGWVYSPFGTNFMRTMLRLAADRREIAVVGDQIGSPTSAFDLARGVIAVARNLCESADPSLRGIFHMTARGGCSWANFAQAIFDVSHELRGPVARVTPLPSRDYPTPARRPADSRLDCTRLAAVHGVELPPWREALPGVLERLVFETRSVPDFAGAST